MTDTPRDPLTALQEGAAQLHEAYLSWVNAGFAPHEALYLCGQILQAGIRKGGEEGWLPFSRLEHGLVRGLPLQGA